MKKNLIVLTAIVVSVSLSGCENTTEDVLAGNVENTQVESIETIQTESRDIENSDIDEPDFNVQDETIYDEPTYMERGNLFLIENVVYNPENNVDMDALAPDGRGYELVKSVSIYNPDKTLAGYTKEDFRIHVVTSNDEWSYCDFGPVTENYLVKTDELTEAISDKDKEMLLAASATPTPAPVPVLTEEPLKTETPKVESTPTVSEPIENELAVNIPVVERPVEEQPVEVESDKYTVADTVEVYKNTIIAGGIVWDPSIKEFASWGTGIISRTDPISVAQAELEGIAFSNDTRYYFEVTDSDENYVYVTVWGCN